MGMLRLALAFLVVAIIAALVGFGVANDVSAFARLLFPLLLVLFLLSLLRAILRSH